MSDFNEFDNEQQNGTQIDGMYIDNENYVNENYDNFTNVEDYNENVDMNPKKRTKFQGSYTPGKSSLICGIIINVVFCILYAIIFFTGYYFVGTILVLAPIYGIVMGVQGIKEGGGQRVMGIFGLLLNVAAILGALLFIALLLFLMV